jgi:ubiquitin-conjugating enzyme E2 Z
MSKEYLPNVMKRIANDLKLLSKDPLDSEEIYYLYNDSDITEGYALIIGPQDTPYEGGFYFFKIKFPENYPIYPPQVEFLSTYNDIRFNPNLYTNGKVCLSIINTWSGPSWTPCNTLTSVLISIKGLVLINDPLLNEPGYSNGNNKKVIDDYTNYIIYQNLLVGVLYFMDNIPVPLSIVGYRDKFKNIILDKFNKYSTNYIKIIDKNLDKEGLNINAPYSCKCTLNYLSLKQKFIEKYEELFDKKLELQNSDIKVENSNKDDSGILSTVNDSVSNDLHISLDNSEEEESETEKEEKEIIVDKLKTKKIKLNELREIANNLNILLFKEGKTGKMVKKNKLDLIKDIKEFIEMNSK